MSESFAVTVAGALLCMGVTASVVILAAILARPLLDRGFSPGARVWVWYYLLFYLLFWTMQFTQYDRTSMGALSIPLPQVYFLWTGGGVFPQVLSEAPVPAELARSLLSSLSPGCPADKNLLSASAGAVFSISLTKLLIWVYLAGIAVLALYYLAGHLLFLRTVRRWSQPPERAESWEEAAAVCSAQNRKVTQLPPLRGFPRYEVDFCQTILLICSRVRGPMAARWLFRNYLILPREDYSPKELHNILLHELNHLFREDLSMRSLILAINILFWFNPLVWVIRRYAFRDIELACDESALEDADAAARRRYCEALLSAVPVAGPGKSTVFTSYFRDSAPTLRERIANIWWQGKRLSSRFWAVLFILPFFASVFFISYAPPVTRPTDAGSLQAYQDARAPENVVVFLDAANAYPKSSALYAWPSAYLDSLTHLPQDDPWHVERYTLNDSQINVRPSYSGEPYSVELRGCLLYPSHPDSPLYQMGRSRDGGVALYQTFAFQQSRGGYLRCISHENL